MLLVCTCTVRLSGLEGVIIGSNAFMYVFHGVCLQLKMDAQYVCICVLRVYVLIHTHSLHMRVCV